MAFLDTLRTQRRAFVKNNGRRMLQALDRYLGRASLVGDHPSLTALESEAKAVSPR